MKCKIENGMKIDTPAKRVIREVLEFISKTINVGCKIYEFHDEIERNSPACDVLAIVGRRNVVVEHTSIDSIPDQRTDDDRFRRALGPLEKELEGGLPAPGYYRLCVDMNVIPTGLNWNVVRQRIREWCLKVASTLEIGGPFTTPRHFIRGTPEGVPFEVTLYRWPGRDGGFKVARFSPDDLERQRLQVICQALATRGAKVAKYGNSGFRTILILESDDIALANNVDIGQALVKAISSPKAIPLPDEVYLVQTETEPYDFCCLKFEDTVFPHAAILKEPYLL